jgi:hypothetical protein
VIHYRFHFIQLSGTTGDFTDSFIINKLKTLEKVKHIQAAPTSKHFQHFPPGKIAFVLRVGADKAW